MDITITRNAFGSQAFSFEADLDVRALCKIDPISRPYRGMRKLAKRFARRLPGGEAAFPRQARGAFLQFRKSGGVEEIPQPGQDAAGSPQIQVSAVHCAELALEFNSPRARCNGAIRW